MGFRTAVVTGATGYVGSHLVRRLLAEGWAAHAIVRPSSDLRLLDPCHGQVILHSHDGSTSGMHSIIGAAKPDVVFHLASMTRSGHRPEDVTQIIQSNITFGTQLLEAMTQCGIRSFINTETFWQHYEGADYNPVCLYAATKQAFRDILTYYANSAAIDAISLVLFDTYGPKDPRKKLFGILKEAASERGILDMTPGEQIVDMTHVADVVEAFVIAAGMIVAGTGGHFQTYTISSGRRMPLKELVELTLRMTGIPLDINWGGRAYRPREVMVPWLGTPLPGWQPKVTLESGIRQVFADRG